MSCLPFTFACSVFAFRSHFDFVHSRKLRLTRLFLASSTISTASRSHRTSHLTTTSSAQDCARLVFRSIGSMSRMVRALSSFNRQNIELLTGRSRNGLQQGNEWILYDVGGTRTLVRLPSLPHLSLPDITNSNSSQRHAWSAFFDDVNAIIFLAPISAIDEKLAEDRRVNRLEDTLLLWRAVCSNKLLARVQLVLFLNKCDLLEKKIRYGLQVKDYIPSYSGSGRENNINAVGKCECLLFDVQVSLVFVLLFL